MKKIKLCALVALSAGTTLLSGCFHNGAVCFDSKCSAFSGASVSKKYYIKQIDVDDGVSLLDRLVQPKTGKTDGKTFAGKRNVERGRKVIRWLDTDGPFKNKFATTSAEGYEPISIKAVISKTNANGGVAQFNNILAFLTFNIWPWYHSADVDYSIEVKSSAGIKKEQFRLQERSLTSWLPLALCPVPAWADYRDMTAYPVEESLEAEQVGRCIISLLAEKADSSGGK